MLHIHLIGEICNKTALNHFRLMIVQFELAKHMKDPAKGQDQATGGNSNAYIFLPIGDTSINVHIERKLRPWRFQKFKIFGFLMLFCIQNGN